MILETKEIPEQEKGSGIILFKSKGYSLLASSPINKKWMFLIIIQIKL